MTGQGASPSTERIVSLDVLRGFALLGILIMNIQSFAMPGAAYLNPTAYGNLEGINLWTWVLSHTFADQKFMSIFSMLFGAGVCLFADRAQQKTGRSAALHYRRTFWLLVFGLLHAYLIWYGDILVAYALCALWVYLFRNRRPVTLFVAGVLVVSVSSLLYLATGFSLEHWPDEAIASIMEAWRPDAAAIAAELAAYRGGWLQQMPLRVPEAVFLQTAVFLAIFVWRAGGMMLIGMALYKWGVLSARKTDRFYLTSCIICGVAGLAIIVLGLQWNFAHGFVLEKSMYLGSQFNYWGSILLSFAYVAAVMLFVRSGVMLRLQQRLAAVGKTAFSNYILQSVICTLLFYGHGLGLFGSVERYRQILIVFAIWLLQLWISSAWLARFRFGPLEWAWRSLTYWHPQPLSRH